MPLLVGGGPTQIFPYPYEASASPSPKNEDLRGVIRGSQRVLIGLGFGNPIIIQYESLHNPSFHVMLVSFHSILNYYLDPWFPFCCPRSSPFDSFFGISQYILIKPLSNPYLIFLL